MTHQKIFGTFALLVLVTHCGSGGTATQQKAALTQQLIDKQYALQGLDTVINDISSNCSAAPSSAGTATTVAAASAAGEGDESATADAPVAVAPSRSVVRAVPSDESVITFTVGEFVVVAGGQELLRGQWHALDADTIAVTLSDGATYAIDLAIDGNQVSISLPQDAVPACAANSSDTPSVAGIACTDAACTP